MGEVGKVRLRPFTPRRIRAVGLCDEVCVVHPFQLLPVDVHVVRHCVFRFPYDGHRFLVGLAHASSLPWRYRDLEERSMEGVERVEGDLVGWGEEDGLGFECAG